MSPPSPAPGPLPGPVVRDAVEADLGACAATYDHEVAHGYATFDTEPQGTAPFERLVADPAAHLLVAEVAGSVAGFAYSSRFRPRPAYDRTREVTVYLRPEAQGRGVGRALYDVLVSRLDAEGMHRLLAMVAQPNPASMRLHAAYGFEPAGTMSEVGWKLGRWVDVTVLERRAPG